MPKLKDFPTHIPEATQVHLTSLQVSCVYMYCEERMTQAEIGQELRPKRSRQAVTKILDRALAKINGLPGRHFEQKCVGRWHDGDEDRVVAMA
jgi:hypothetical protein